jgi:pyridoxal phosphate enzyme (YggS family)
VQEAQATGPRVRELLGRDPTWHMIGSLQRNKVRACLGLFDLVHSVDGARLAEAISERAEGGAAAVLLEVYFGDDPTRPGFRPGDLLGEAGAVLALPNLDVRGLMTVAPLGARGEAARAVFRRLRELRDELRARHPDARLAELSMGMTDDYPLAIAEGATIVRVGRAIFGERATQ